MAHPRPMPAAARRGWSVMTFSRPSVAHLFHSPKFVCGQHGSLLVGEALKLAQVMRHALGEQLRGRLRWRDVAWLITDMLIEPVLERVAAMPSGFLQGAQPVHRMASFAAIRAQSVGQPFARGIRIVGQLRPHGASEIFLSATSHCSGFYGVFEGLDEQPFLPCTN